MRMTLGSLRLLALLLLVACSATPLSRSKSVDANGASESRGPGDARNTSEPLVPSDASGVNLTVGPPDASGTNRGLGEDASFACSSVSTETCDPESCAFPVDWASAQAPSAWCHGDTPPNLTLSLCHANNGYDLAVLSYDIGGEMFIVDRVFFVYDSATGRFVQELYKRFPGGTAVCWQGTSDGPAAPVVDPRGPCPGPEIALQPICSPLSTDGGS